MANKSSTREDWSRSYQIALKIEKHINIFVSYHDHHYVIQTVCYILPDKKATNGFAMPQAQTLKLQNQRQQQQE